MDKTLNGIEKVREILLCWKNSIEIIRQCWLDIRDLNPNFEQVSDEEWRKKSSRCWLHGATEVSEYAILEEWLYTPVSLSSTALSKAMIHYDAWGDFTQEHGVYADFSTEDLLKPKSLERLHEYVWRLAENVHEKGWGTKKNKRALRSFLSHLRKSNPQIGIAFVEQIFPEKMGLHCNSLIRLIKPQAHRIPEEIAGKINEALAQEVICGRPDARFKSAEALALCLLCLISSRLRLPTTLESIHSISIKSLVVEEGISYLKIPTIFGTQKIQVSIRCAEFLQAINNMPFPLCREEIISSDLRSLRRPLRSAIKKAKISPEFNKITFLTFMSPPHGFGENIRPRSEPVTSKKKTVP